MNRKGQLSSLRDALETLLTDTYEDPSDELVHKIVELATLLKDTYTPTEWDALCDSIRRSLGLDEGELSRRLGATQAVGVPTVDPPREGENFLALVPDGWFRDYLEYTAESEAPTQFHFGAAITTIAATMGRLPCIGWDALPTFPNIYTILVGPTGSRKSTAIRLATDLLGPPLKEQLNLLPNEGSQQGFASALRKRNYEVTNISDGLIVASELTVLLGHDKYKTDLHKWLTDWYDCPEMWSRALKSEDYYEIIKPYVCFLGASNLEWMKGMPMEAVKGGYLPRNMIFEASGKRHVKAQPKFNPLLKERLQLAISTRLTDLPAYMPISDESSAIIDNWYTSKVAIQEETAHDELFMAWLARKLPHALKLACVWQIADGGPHDKLQAKWLSQSIAIVDWMDTGVRRVYGTLGVTEEGAVQAEVLRVIHSKGGKATQSELIRALRNKYKSARVLEGLKTLQQAKQIRPDVNPIEGAVWIVTGR